MSLASTVIGKAARGGGKEGGMAETLTGRGEEGDSKVTAISASRVLFCTSTCISSGRFMSGDLEGGA